MGVLDLSASSTSISQPTKGRGWFPKAPSRYAVQKSWAVPMASSALLLKLLPNDGPIWLLSSIAAMSSFYAGQAGPTVLSDERNPVMRAQHGLDESPRLQARLPEQHRLLKR